MPLVWTWYIKVKVQSLTQVKNQFVDQMHFICLSLKINEAVPIRNHPIASNVSSYFIVLI